jgi:hypothetical protein
MNMACANKDCRAELKYLRGGRLFLMERQPNLPHLISYDPSQPKRPVTMRRYFWLCESCAQTYAIRRWTEAGIELAPRRSAKRAPMSVPAHPRDWAVPGLVG